MELSIIIVSYNCAALLKKCLASIYANAPDFDFEVIVVDNDSQDNSEEHITKEFNKVKWINAGYNSGFSRANNAGIRNSVGKYVLLLNPDTQVQKGFLKSFVEFYKQKDKQGKLGLLGCRIISSVDGSLLVGTGIGFPSIRKVLMSNPFVVFLQRVFKYNSIKKYNSTVMHYKNHEVDFVSGACVMIKRSVVFSKNLFLDEDFFLYSEDVEYSFRVKRAGYTNFFCSELEVLHVNSATTDNISGGKSNQILLSRFLFILKAYGVFYYLLYLFAIKMNWCISKLFDFKNKLFARDKAAIDINIERQNNIVKQYGFSILRNYYFKSPSTDYLRYV